jgi:hypothetical protein
MFPRHSCFIGLLFVAYLAQAQEVSWVRTYEVSPHASSAWDVIHLPGGGFVAAGDALFPPDSGSFQGWVMRTDLRGEIVWSRLYGTTASEGFTSLTLMNSQLWIVGNNSSWPILYQITLSGDSLWSRTFTDGQLGHGLNRVLATPDEHLLITTSHPVLAKLDTLGNVIWSIRGPEYHSQVNALALLPEGGYVVACNTNSLWQYEDTIAIRIYWVNEGGTILDSVDFSHYAWNEADCILPISQDEVIVGGFTEPGYQSYNEYPLVFQTDRTGQVDWEFVGTHDYLGRTVSGVHLVNDSVWAVTYNLYLEFGTQSLYMCMFDLSGNLHGGLAVDVSPMGNSNDNAYATAFVEPASIIITGATSMISSPWKAFLALVSSTSGTDEKWRGTHNLPVRAELKVILSAETAIIELPEPIQGEVSIVIYDILGRTIYQTRQLMLNTQFVSFPMRVPSGMYFVTATNTQHQWHGRAVLCR